MKNNNILPGCFCLSLVFHTAFFTIVSLPHPAALIKPPKKPIEVSYVQNAVKKTKPITEYTKTQREKDAYKKTLDTKTESSLWKTHSVLQEFLKTESIGKTPATKPFSEKQTLGLTPTISLPAVPGDTARTPEYKNYYQIIREKIRRLAYSHYKKLEEGEVYLTFLLSANGELINITFNEKRSSPDEYLRSIALKSVQEAAPYPEFPEKLKTHTQLTFHVIISFELK